MKKILLMFLIVLLCCALSVTVFALETVSDETDEVANGSENTETEQTETESTYTPVDVSAYGEPVESWDISKTEGVDSVTATLYNDPDRSGYYVMVIDGIGAMMDWDSSDHYWTDARLNSYSQYIYRVIIGDYVSSVGDRAFNYCRNLNFVEIGEGVTSIGIKSFYECDLYKVKIGRLVESIESDAFGACYKLVEVFNQSSLNIVKGDGGSENNGAIGRYLINLYTDSTLASNVFVDEEGFVFYYDDSSCFLLDYVGNLKSLVLPPDYKGKNYEIYYRAFGNDNNITSLYCSSGVTKIQDYAFYSCENLSEIIMDNSITQLGSYLFYSCKALTSIEFPSALESIGEQSFASFGSLKYNVYGNCWYLGNTKAPYMILVKAESTSITECTINESTRFICNSAFYDCVFLTEVKYNATDVSNISMANNIFRNAGNNSEGIIVIFGKSVAKIPNNLFYPVWKGSYCPNIVEVKFEESSECTSVGSYAFAYCKNLKSVTIPENVEKIGDYAFFGCENMEELYFNAKNASMALANQNCTFLNAGISGEGIKIFVGSQVVNIPEYFAYYGINDKPAKIKSCEFADNSSCIRIGEYAFYNSPIQSIELPETLETIGTEAFYGCYDLDEVVNNSSLEIYLGDTNNGYVAKYATDIHTGDILGCVDEGDFRFYTDMDGNHYLVRSLAKYTTLVLPETYRDSVYSIGAYAFYNYAGITDIVLPDSVTGICNGAFYNCKALSGFNFPSALEFIGDYAFYSCVSLKTVDIPAGMKTIGSRAFESCSLINRINFNAVDMENISDYSFVYHKAGSGGNGISVIIGSEVVSIPDNFLSGYHPSYSGAPFVVNVYFEENSKCIRIGNHAFDEISTLTEIELPPNLVEIGEYAFYYSGIRSIVLPESVTTIGERAFLCCFSLNQINIPVNVGYIGAYAFNSCSNLSLVKIDSAEIADIVSCGTEDYLLYYAKTVVLPESFGIKNNISERCNNLSLVEYTCVDGTTYNYRLFSTHNHLESATCWNSIERAPTTIFEGFYGYECAECGVRKGVELPPLNIFVYSAEFTTPVTCTEDGVLTYNITRGGIDFTFDTVAPAYGHNWTDWEIVTNPTVEDEGAASRVCRRDQAHVESSTLPVLMSDSYTLNVIESPMCETYGQGVYSILIEDCELSFEDIIPALGHAYCEWVVVTEPTYSTYGERQRVCNNDSSHTESEVIDKLVAVVVPEVTESGIADVTLGTDNVTVLPEDSNIVISAESGNTGVTSSVAELTAELVTQLAGKEMNYTTDLGKVVLDSVATEKLAALGKQIDITVTDITITEELENGKIAFSINVTADGEDVLPYGEAGNGIITLSFVYKKGLHKDFVRVAYRAENGETENVAVTDYDPVTGVVTFDTTHLSDYEIYGIDLPEISGMYLNLTESINVFYTAQIPEEFENPYMVFTLLGNEYTVTEYTIRQDGKYAFRFADVLPQYMGETITATLYANRGGVPYSVANSDMSIRSYCEYTLTAYAADTSLVKLLSDLLTFGEKAQLYMGYKVDELVTTGLNLTVSDYLEPSNAFSLDGEISDLADWVGFGLNFTGTVNSYITLKADNIEGLAVNVTVNGRSVTYNLEDMAESPDGKYKIYLREIMAYELDDIISATLTYKGEQIGRTLTYSVKTYACYLDSIGASDELVALVESMCNYGSSAYNYFYKTEEK